MAEKSGVKKKIIERKRSHLDLNETKKFRQDSKKEMKIKTKKANSTDISEKMIIFKPISEKNNHS